ncbi:phosphoesterase [Bacilli bacterium]|nr:phosphoesterase [Bacilli bacterium]
MIIVMSDSHGESKIVQEIKARYQNTASAIIHCGDSELDATDAIWDGITVVKGNCDFDDGFPETTILQADHERIFVTHGHLFGVNFGLSRLTTAARENNCEMALFGHLHTPIATIEAGVLCLNPGSVSQPRGGYNIKMYAKIEPTRKCYRISYLDIDHQPIPNLQFELPRSSK